MQELLVGNCLVILMLRSSQTCPADSTFSTLATHGRQGIRNSSAHSDLGRFSALSSQKTNIRS